MNEGSDLITELRERIAVLEGPAQKFVGLSAELESAKDHIAYLLPLARGYVAAHPGIRSTQDIVDNAEAFVQLKACPYCEGSGRVNQDGDCPQCYGDGQVPWGEGRWPR